MNHERLCKCNPDRKLNDICISGVAKKYKHTNQYTKAKELGLPRPIMSDETREKYRLARLNTTLSDETKKKISESMKLAHKEGRAHNIGECRWNNKPSYPEQWFMKVIENEKINSNYIREFPFHRYSLDFAWPDLKLCIEIDGEQHQRFEEYKIRDQQKDKLLQEEGWKLLRIPWKECFNNPKHYIQLVKNLFN